MITAASKGQVKEERKFSDFKDKKHFAHTREKKIIVTMNRRCLIRAKIYVYEEKNADIQHLSTFLMAIPGFMKGIRRSKSKFRRVWSYFLLHCLQKKTYTFFLSLTLYQTTKFGCDQI